MNGNQTFQRNFRDGHCVSNMEESGNQNLYGWFQNGQRVTHNTLQQNQVAATEHPKVVTWVQIPTEDSKMATISHPEIKTSEKTGTEIFIMATNLYTEETLLKCSRTIRKRDFILKMATTSYTTGTSLPVTIFINFNMAANREKEFHTGTVTKQNSKWPPNNNDNGQWKRNKQLPFEETNGFFSEQIHQNTLGEYNCLNSQYFAGKSKFQNSEFYNN